MKVVFICGPYRAETNEKILANIARAKIWARQYWESGVAVICPHMNSAMMGGDVKEKIFLDGYIEILGRCDTLFAMPGWENSEGARAEVKEAWRLGIEIVYG